MTGFDLMSLRRGTKVKGSGQECPLYIETG